jgi:hypothetical protein
MKKMSLATATDAAESKPEKTKIEDKPMTPDDREKLLKLAREGASVKLISVKTGFAQDWVAYTIDACLENIDLKIKLTEGYFDDVQKNRRKPVK